MTCVVYWELNVGQYTVNLMAGIASDSVNNVFMIRFERS